jgi:hypothetical protein
LPILTKIKIYHIFRSIHFSKSILISVLTFGTKYICVRIFCIHKLMRGGRNVEFQNYDWPKISEHWNCLFSWSLLQNQNIETVFLVDQNIENQCLFSSSLLRQKFRLSMFWFYLWRQKRSESWKSKTLTTYGVLPMFTKACGELG